MSSYLQRVSVSLRRGIATSCRTSFSGEQVQDKRDQNVQAETVEQSTTPQDIEIADARQNKTTAERDEELRLKMAGLAGEGGEAGVEYEDGQPVAMKRSVKNNMFRYI